MKNRILAVLIAICLLASTVPMGVLAEKTVVYAEMVDEIVREAGANGETGALELITEDEKVAEQDDVDLSELGDEKFRELWDVDLSDMDGDSPTEGTLIYGTEDDSAGVTDETGVAHTGESKAETPAKAPEKAADDAEKAAGDAGKASDAKPEGDEAKKNTVDKPEGSSDSETAEVPEAKEDGETIDQPEGDGDEETPEKPEGIEDANIPQKPEGEAAENPENEANGETDEKPDDETVEKTNGETAENTDGDDTEKLDGEATERPDGEAAEKTDGETNGETEGEAAGKPDGDTDDESAPEQMKSEPGEDAGNPDGPVEGDDSTDGAEPDGAEPEGDCASEAAPEDPQEAQTAEEAALTVDQTALTLLVAETCALKASGGTGAIAWSSENAGVAAVDASGVVTAVAAGTARIVAKDEKGVVAACNVTVVDVPGDVIFAVDTLALGLKELRTPPGFLWAGGTKIYQGAAVYASSDPKKVAVTADGRIRGVAKGSAVITATLSNGKVLQCTVVVRNAPSKITITPDKQSMGVGETLLLAYKLPAGTGSAVTWSSSNAGVASVDPNTGLISAISPGTVRITGKTYNNKRASATVTVYAVPTTVAFTSKTIAVGLGETIEPKVILNDGAFSNCTFALANPGIAAVNGNQITGAALGETQITVTTYNGLQDTATLLVLPAPEAVNLPYKTLRIGRGDSVQLLPNMGNGASKLRYSSSKKSVVKVTEDGVVKGLKRGTAYVTMRTFNNKSYRLKVVVKRAPGWIKAAVNPLNLGVGEKYTLGYTTPAGTAGSVVYSGDAPSVFSVNALTGEITGIAPGTGNVTLTSYNGKVTVCPVTVYNAPTQVQFNPTQVSVAKKQKLQLQMVFDEGAWSNIVYEIADPKVVKIDANGTLTGLQVGQTVIRANTFVPGLYAETVFTVWGEPSKVWFDAKSVSVNVGDAFVLVPRIPVGSQTTFKFKSSNKKVATVTAEGIVQTFKKGKAKITVTTHNGKKATLTLKVSDPGKPTSLTLKSKDIPVLYAGETWQVEYEFAPANAIPELVWTSSNTSVAVVDQLGVVTAMGYGSTTIKAVSARNKKLSFSFKQYVQTKSLSLDIPERTTDIAGIPANLAKINAIKDSTLMEIDRLKSSGQLTADSAVTRKAIVENIFKNYAFPWMTPSLQKYWKAANSENGAKDFKADRVYYGLPYISGSGANRRYNAALALSEGRYTDSGQGYYVLNQGNYLNGKYVGNDCSGLVNVSIWGTSDAHSADRTDDIATNAAYYTVGSFAEMLPGDLICKANAHVVMFLYYASDDKSKIMIIENGGSEKGTNTVHCDVHKASSYQKSGYSVRRVVGL